MTTIKPATSVRTLPREMFTQPSETLRAQQVADSCKITTDEIAGAQNINYAPKSPLKK